MAKYSYEFKQKVVKEYLNGEGSYAHLAKKYNIPSSTPIKEWVASFKEFGKEGLLRSRKNKNYSFQFKLSVVELYLTSEVSYQELAISRGIKNSPIISKWVNDFRIAGPDALKPKKKGRKKKLDMESIKNNPPKNIEEKSIDTSAEHIRACSHKINMQIFKHNFAKFKAKICRNTGVLQEFLTQKLVKFAKKMNVELYVNTL